MYSSVIKIKPTDKTPLLEYNPKTGVFNVIGVSVPDSAMDFYTPVLDWIDGYIKDPNDSIIINVKLDYFSIQSSRYLLKIFKKFELLKGDSKVKVVWHYDDPDIEESGRDFSIMCNLEFEMMSDEINEI